MHAGELRGGERPPLLIVARSGRILAQSARTRWTPWVLDFFADEDTREVAVWVGRLRPQPGWSFDGDELERALEAACERAGGELAMVVGAGFEQQAGLLAHLPPGLHLLGSGPAAFSRIEQVPGQAGLRLDLNAAGFPPSFDDADAPPGRWVYKTRGETGGAHVRTRPPAQPGPRDYRQAFVSGRHLSCLALAAAGAARVCGVASQLDVGFGAGNYLYRGAVSIPNPPARLLSRLDMTAAALARRLGLVGGFGFDFILDRDGRIEVVDVNPRLTATLELYDDAVAVFDAHVLACTEHRLLYSRPALRPARGQLVVFAERAWCVPPEFDWPRATADRPVAGTRVDSGDPLVTLVNEAASMTDVLRNLERAHGTLARHVDAVLPGVVRSEIKIKRRGEESWQA